jgi:chromosome segregation ATPase
MLKDESYGRTSNQGEEVRPRFLIFRSAENELDKLTRYIPSETERVNNVLEDLTARLRQVQADRTETLSKLEGLQSKHARECSRLEKDKLTAQEAADHSHRQLRKLVIQHQETKDETVKLTSELVTQQHTWKKLVESTSKDAFQHSHDLTIQA